jgi:predicted nuclease of restriction endonuclease-like RecB superfamily
VLPSELLLVRRRKGRIWPRYAKLSDENLDVAKLLTEAYSRHVGEKKNVLKAFVGELEDTGYDYRFVRGLSVLLDRRSVFMCNVKVDPVDLRRRLYQATRKLGLPTTRERRSRIIASVASELELTVETLEESFYADLDSELVLAEFNPSSPQELLKAYNLSMTQTLLFNSTELNFTASGNWQRIFYAVKRLGLIYEAYRDAGFWVKIDGPASLFRMTRRYGTALAKLLPAIIANPEWTVEAKILWKYTNEICDFKIESQRHGVLLMKTKPSTVSYDSAVEEDFAARFHAFKSRWRLRREPEPVPAGRHVIIPDFSFEREGVKVFMEVVGFWTAEYLRRKIEKLKKIDVNMLVAVNETLACEKLTKLEMHTKLNIVYYRNKVPLSPILRYLEDKYQRVEEKQTWFVKNLPVTFLEPVVNYAEFAARIGVSTESVRAALNENPPQGYMVLPNSLVRKETLKEIGKTLEEQISRTGRLPLFEATKIIETKGVKDVSNVLKALGYKIMWRGISEETAEVIKAETTQTRKNS